MVSMVVLLLTISACHMLPHSTSTALPVEDYASTQDTIRPNIWGWDIIGNPADFSPFLVWANVSDADSGIQNVTLRISGPNVSLNAIMEFNASTTLYERDVAPFPNNGTFYLQVEAFDNYNNSRTSTSRTIEAYSGSDDTIDPWLTMPLVVVSSLLMIAVVIGFALIYDRRRGPS